MQARSLQLRGRAAGCGPSMSRGARRCVARAPRAVFHYMELELETGPGISVHNIMPHLRAEVERLGVKEGFVNVLSRWGDTDRGREPEGATSQRIAGRGCRREQVMQAGDHVAHQRAALPQTLKPMDAVRPTLTELHRAPALLVPHPGTQPLLCALMSTRLGCWMTFGRWGFSCGLKGKQLAPYSMLHCSWQWSSC